MERKNTKIIKIGNLKIGGDNKIAIQSMTNTKTKDIPNTVAQILALEKAGCDIVRVAVKDQEDALAIKEIKKQIHIPLVADIHFDYRLALSSIQAGVDKIRLNPGNIENEEYIKEVINLCKEKEIPIRVGVNTGSLPKDLERNEQGLIEAAKRHVKILEDNGFYNIVLSFKASDINLMVKTYKLASETFPYPLHLGLTEAGSLYSGSVKSAIAIGSLLLDGIGDTIRVSLSDDPVLEIKAAKEILKNIGLLKGEPKIVSCPTCGRCEYDMFSLLKEVENYLDNVHKDIKVAVMGCIVNGPGEAKDADLAICGGKDTILLYKNGEMIAKTDSKNVLNMLKKEIDEF